MMSVSLPRGTSQSIDCVIEERRRGGRTVAHRDGGSTGEVSFTSCVRKKETTFNRIPGIVLRQDLPGLSRFSMLFE